MPQGMSSDQINTIKAAALKEGYSEGEIESLLIQKGLMQDPSTQPNIRQDLKKFTANMPAAPVEASVEGGLGKTLLSGGLGALAGIGTAATGVGIPASGLVGSATMALSDSLIDRFMGAPAKHPIAEFTGISEPGKPIGNPMMDTASSALEGTVMNEALAKIIGIPLKVSGNIAANIFKEADVSASPNTWGSWKELAPFSGTSRIPFLVNKAQSNLAFLRDKAIAKFGGLGPVGKGSVSGALAEFSPTFTQYADKPHHLAEAVENIFARKQKEEAGRVASEIGMQKLEEKLGDLTGRKISLKDADILTTRMQNAAQVNFTNLSDAMTDTQDALKLVNKGSAAEKKLKSQLAELTDAMALFIPRGERGLKASDLTTIGPARVGNINYPTPIINAIADDAQKMQRFIDSGEIKVGNKVITSASSRGDLKGYQFMRLVNDAYDPASKNLDAGKLINSWDKYKTTSMGSKLYNAQNRADIDELFKNIHKVGIGENTPGASRYLTLRLGTGAAALGSGLVTGMLGGAVPALGASGAIVGGSIALNQLGKLMTNPETARLLIAMSSAGPLNMSPKIAGRIIARALRNQPMTIQLKDSATGQIIDMEGKLDNTGKFQPNK